MKARSTPGERAGRALALLVGLLKSVGLVDEQLRWSAGATHLA
jgi:hypothetical protein